MNPKDKKHTGSGDPQAEPGLGGTAFARREFFGRITGLTAATGLSLPALLGSETARAEQAVSSSNQRRNLAYQTRQQAAMAQMQQPAVDHPDNGDERLYASKIASFSKGLPHNELGEVD